MARYQDMRKISMELNSAFDDTMYSECARQFKYKTESVCEVLLNAYFKIVGSRAEGTHSCDSDLDLLVIDQIGVKVGYNPQEAGTDSGIPYLRLIRGPLTPAGYTQFQIYLNSSNCENIENTTLQSLFMYEIERYNSNTIFLTNRKLMDKLHPFNLADNGPAQTVYLSNDESIDKVLAYESKIIPTDMNRWFDRTRLKTWPSKTTCELFKSMGCFYVSVGRSKSPEQEFEWRISPTKQELYLMLNLNPTQFRCYILLKLIKKSMHKDCVGGISSYHCKTALFWTIENNENNIWQPQNLIECVLKCLELLLVWVTEKKCPNYFIPEENMFETRVMHELHLKLQAVIQYFRICSQFLLRLIIGSYRKIDAIIESTIILKQCLSESIFRTSLLPEHAFHTIRKLIEFIKTKPRNECIQKFQDWVSPHEIDIDILLQMLEEKLCCLNRKFHLKSLFGSNTFREKDITAYLNDPSRKSHIDHEYCLKLASIAATQGAYSTCDVLLQNVQIMKKLDIYCRCSISLKKNDTLHLVLNNISENIRSTGQSINQLSISDILHRFSLCLQFRDSKNEAGIVMSPCHFEAHKTVGIPSKMILKQMTNLKFDLNVITDVDYVSIHPTAYLYFLQYKNSGMMNKKGDVLVALEKLENMNLISLQKGIYTHPDTTLNLLGHIFTNKGWDRLAVQCFRRSWQVQPYYNAVKWHVVFMLFCNLSIPEEEKTNVVF